MCFTKRFSSYCLYKLRDVRKKNDLVIVAVVKACKMMSQSKTGAISVLDRQSDLSFTYNNGESIHAAVSQRLIESIFYKKIINESNNNAICYSLSTWCNCPSVTICQDVSRAQEKTTK